MAGSAALQDLAKELEELRERRIREAEAHRHRRAQRLGIPLRDAHGGQPGGRKQPAAMEEPVPVFASHASTWRDDPTSGEAPGPEQDEVRRPRVASAVVVPHEDREIGRKRGREQAPAQPPASEQDKKRARRLLGGLLVGSLQQAQRRATEEQQSEVAQRRREILKKVDEKAEEDAKKAAVAYRERVRQQSAAARRERAENLAKEKQIAAEIRFVKQVEHERTLVPFLRTRCSRPAPVFWLPKRTGDAARDAWIDALLAARQEEFAVWEREGRDRLETTKVRIRDRVMGAMAKHGADDEAGAGRERGEEAEGGPVDGEREEGGAKGNEEDDAGAEAAADAAADEAEAEMAEEARREGAARGGGEGAEIERQGMEGEQVDYGDDAMEYGEPGRDAPGEGGGEGWAGQATRGGVTEEDRLAMEEMERAAEEARRKKRDRFARAHPSERLMEGRGAGLMEGRMGGPTEGRGAALPNTSRAGEPAWDHASGSWRGAGGRQARGGGEWDGGMETGSWEEGMRREGGRRGGEGASVREEGRRDGARAGNGRADSPGRAGRSGDWRDRSRGERRSTDGGTRAGRDIREVAEEGEVVAPDVDAEMAAVDREHVEDPQGVEDLL